MSMKSINISKFFRQIADSLLEGIIVVDAQSRIVLCNAAAEQFMGKTYQHIPGQAIHKFLPQSHLSKVILSGQPEIGLQWSIGTIKVVSNLAPLFDSDGQIVGAFEICSRAENINDQISSLLETRVLLEAIINATKDAISVVDEHGKGILINPAYTTLTGLTEKDIIQQPANIDIAEGDSMHLKVLETRQPVYNARMKVGPNRKDVVVNVSPVFIDKELKGSVAVIHDISEIRRLTKELEYAKNKMNFTEAKYTFDDIIGSSSAIQFAVEQAKLISSTNASVLLRGESGTGKELFAHAIHNTSNRKKSKFIRVNCAAITETLLESELFGYVDGAFTGAKKGGKTGFFWEANGGTIFLDEIGELSINLQSKLLRVLQEKEFTPVGDTKPIPLDVRVIAATNANLERLIEKKLFREDLYYRLNMAPIFIPSLRQRKDDIPVLSEYIIRKFNQEFGRSIQSISESAIKILQARNWPGNIRELENSIGHAIINMQPSEKIICAEHISGDKLIFDVPVCQLGLSDLDNHSSNKSYADLFDEWEKQLLIKVLNECQGNKTKAASRLKISVRSLHYKIRKHL